MKKLIILISALLLITGCNNPFLKNKEEKTTNPIIIKDISITKENDYNSNYIWEYSIDNDIIELVKVNEQKSSNNKTKTTWIFKALTPGNVNITFNHINHDDYDKIDNTITYIYKIDNDLKITSYGIQKK